MSGEGPGYGVGAVAGRLGVAPATLRTWERRYGIGPSSRSVGGHRRYAENDVTRLEAMQRLILAGAAPGEAARTALTGVPEPAPAKGSGHGGGGRRIALPGRSAEARGLARAAMALDDHAMDAMLRDALRRRGVVRTWDETVVPVLTGIGDRPDCVEHEHLLSARVQAALTAVAGRLGNAVNGRTVLLASAAEDQHCLPLYALAAALAKERLAARVLGARLPYPALAGAMRRTGPAAVFLWSQLAETGDPAPLAELPASRPAPRLIVGGPGWARRRLPSGVRVARTLTEGVAEIRSALGIG